MKEKLSTRIDIPVSEALEAKLVALATMVGKPRAQLARELLTVQVEGMYAWMKEQEGEKP